MRGELDLCPETLPMSMETSFFSTVKQRSAWSGFVTWRRAAVILDSEFSVRILSRTLMSLQALYAQNSRI